MIQPLRSSPFDGGGVRPVNPNDHLPPGFEDVFGRLPDSNDYPSGQYRQWAVDVGQWFKNLGNFAESGTKPAWATKAQVDTANEKLDQYAVPHPKYFRFQHRAEDPTANGEWQAVFRVPVRATDWPGRPGWFQCPAVNVVTLTAYAIMGYQGDCLERGIDPTGGNKDLRFPWIRQWPGDPEIPEEHHG